MSIQVKKENKVVCVYADESCLPSVDVLKQMKSAGYKLYKDGKIYKINNK